MVLSREINKIPEFYTILPEIRNNCPKNILPNLGVGARAPCPPPPTPMAAIDRVL